MSIFLFLTLLCLVYVTHSCPLLCSCNLSRTNHGIEYSWHCGYQDLKNEHLDLIVNNGNVSDVDILYLDGNKFSSLDTAKFKRFTKLKTLHINNNSLSIYPSTINRDVPSLEILSLVNNSINMLNSDSFVHSLNLKTLSLAGNIIHTLKADIFSSLAKLQELDISRNKIHDVFSESLHGLKSLKKLFLNGNEIVSIPNGIFDGLFNLEELNFSENQLQKIQPKTLSHLAQLHHVDFSRNQISTIEEGAVFDSKLVSLDVSKNELVQITSNAFKNSAVASIILDSNPLNCNCLLNALFISLQNNLTTISNGETLSVSGSCQISNQKREISLANFTDNFKCNFDCINNVTCQNDGICELVTNNDVLLYQCQCKSNFDGEICENKLKNSKNRAFTIIIMIVVIPVAAIIIGLLLFWRQYRKSRNQDKHDAMSYPLTDDDFSL